MNIFVLNALKAIKDRTMKELLELIAQNCQTGEIFVC